ncbi:hypothetical protein U1Q18_008789 [Sarracenia purpurea var. burkii]
MSSRSKVASVDSSSHEHDDGDLSSQLLRDLNMEEFRFMGSPVASVSSSSFSLLRKVYDTLETKLRKVYDTLETKLRRKFEVSSVEASSHKDDDGDHSKVFRNLDLEEFGFISSPVSNNIVAPVSSSSCSSLQKEYHDTLETELRQKLEVSSVEASSHKDDDGDHSKVFRNLDLEEFGFISSPVSNNIVAPVELRQKFEVSSVEASSHKDDDGDHSKVFRNLDLEEFGFISSPVSNDIVAPVSSLSFSSLRKEYHDTLETELRQKLEVSSIEASSHKDDDGDHSKVFRNLDLEEFGFISSPVSNNIVAPVSSSSCSSLRKEYHDTLETELRQKLEVSSIESSSHKDGDGDHSKSFRNLNLEECGFISSPVNNNIVAPVSSSSCSSLRKEDDSPETEFRRMLSKLPRISTSSSESEHPSSYLSYPNISWPQPCFRNGGNCNTSQPSGASSELLSIY